MARSRLSPRPLAGRIGLLPVFLGLAAVPLALAEDSAATPLSKVLELLEGLSAKGIKEKEEEATKFGTFALWCQDQSRTKTGEIKDDEAKMAETKAAIEKANAEITAFTARIGELNGNIEKWAVEQKNATAVREKEAADYAASQKDLAESVDAITRAVTTLKSQGQAKAATALLQVRSRLTTKRERDALEVFLQQDQLPDKGAYEVQSGGVVEMLEKLKDQFSQQARDLEREETKARNAYETVSAQLTSNTEFAKTEVAEKTRSLADSKEALAQAQGGLAEATKELGEDKKYLEDTTVMCATKQSDFDERQKIRAQELVALQKATEILKTKVASKAAVLLQVRKQVNAATSLAMLRSRSSEDEIQAELAEFLSDRAATLKSRRLALLAQQVAADPFGKVRKMLNDLIERLTQEGAQEVEQKAWCDGELKNNKATREEKTTQVSTLKAKADGLTANIAQLTEEIQVLGTKLKELEEARAKATTERQASKARNEATIKTAKECQAGVQEATSVLREFYSTLSPAAAKAFLQEEADPKKDAPETFSEPYKGLAPNGGSVLDFLEVILSDYAKLDSETAAAEATEAKQYTKFMDDSDQDKIMKSKEQTYKGEKKVELAGELQLTNDELKATQDQLDKALEYYEKLKLTCVNTGVSYEERVKQRKEEMKSLQEAVDLLSASGQ